MATWAQLRAAIKTELDTVANVGKTHGYERYASDWANFLGHFKDGTGIVRGWTIHRETMAVEINALDQPNMRLDQTVAVVLRGYMGLNDSGDTQATFDALLDTVMAAFNGQPSLHADVRLIGPCQLQRNEWRNFGGVLCHYCEIAIPILAETTVAIG